MPMPRWMAKVNRRVFNGPEVKRGIRPVPSHVGPSSGEPCRTPPAAGNPPGCWPVENGYIFTVVYGSESDWVKNVLTTGSTSLRIDGDVIDLVSPRLLTKDLAMEEMPATTKAPPGFLRVTEYLQVDTKPDVWDTST